MADATQPDASTGSCYASVTVPSRVESIQLAADFLVQAARNMHVPCAGDSLFETAIVEALNNAVEHGNAGQRPDALTVCEVELVGRRLTVRILGQGPAFALPPASLPEWNVEDMTTVPESGYGIHIIRGVFPMVRTIAHADEFGIEMALTF